VPARILLLDIETAPAQAYVWRMYDENISPEQLIRPSRVLMVGVKWLGKPTVTIYDMTQLKAVRDLMAEADAIITFNGDKFDLPKLMGEFVERNIAAPPPVASIDLLKTVKRLGLTSNRLAHVAPYLGVGSKMKHEGFDLWRRVVEGDKKAWEKMARYCKQDVRLLEPLYLKLRPYIKTHPYIGDRANTCPHCGSTDIQHRGTRRTKAFFIERLHCTSCGAWSDGSRKKVAA